MRIDGISAVLIVLIASFAIDRAVTFTEFVLRSIPALRRHVVRPHADDDPYASEAATNRATWIHYGLATLFAGGIMAGFGNVRLLAAVGFPQANWLVDILITTIVLVGGSERVADIIKATGLPDGGKTVTPSQPIQITGTLVLDDASMRRFQQPLA